MYRAWRKKRTACKLELLECMKMDGERGENGWKVMTGNSWIDNKLIDLAVYFLWCRYSKKKTFPSHCDLKWKTATECICWMGRNAWFVEWVNVQYKVRRNLANHKRIFKSQRDIRASFWDPVAQKLYIFRVLPKGLYCVTSFGNK